jgi:hypothetical protein
MITAFQRLCVFVGLMALFAFVMGVVFPVAYLWNALVPFSAQKQKHGGS